MADFKWLRNLFGDEPDYDLIIKHFQQEITTRQDDIKDIEEHARLEITEHKEAIKELEILINEANLDKVKQERNDK